MDISEFLMDEAAFKALQEPREMMQRLMSGETFQHIIGFSNDTMFEFYDAARRIFERRDYANAVDAFVFLTTLNPAVAEFWIGLGLAQYHAHLLEEALVSFKWAVVTRPESIETYMHAVKCALDLGRTDEALMIAEQAVETAEEEDGLEALKREAYELKAYVQAQMEKDLTH